MAFLFSALVLFLVSGALGQDRLVDVHYYAESLCPDCLAFSKGPMNDAINKVINFACISVVLIIAFSYQLLQYGHFSIY